MTKARITKRTITIVEPKGWPEFSEQDWQSVQWWMKDRRIPNLQAFHRYIGIRESVFDATLAALKKGKAALDKKERP